MPRKNLFPVILVLLISILAAIPAVAATQPTSSARFQPSNYCQACHSTGDSRLMDATTWVGGIEHNLVDPCPATTQINEEIYYTERLMLAIERAKGQLPAGTDLGKSETRLEEAEQQYSRLLDTPVTSLDAFNAEAAMVRYQLGKVYSAISQTAIESVKRTRVLWTAIGVSIFIIASLVWGWVNARKALRAPKELSKKSFSFYFYRVLILALIFIFFALPIFRLPSQAVTMPSAEDQERQLVLDETARAASTGDRELGRAWMLARIGAVWTQYDPERGAAALDEALTAAQEAQNNAAALWGLSRSAWEAGGAEYAKKAQAALVASDLDAVRGRVWGLRLIAEAWMDVDETQAEAILENALALVEGAVYPYAQLDLRAISVTWAQLDAERGIAVARGILDPALRSWAFREIAVAIGDASPFDLAAEAARQVGDPIEQARLLSEIGGVSGVTTYFDEATGVLQGVDSGALAFALAEIAVTAGDPAYTTLISADYPAAQALAYFGLGEYPNAWKAAAEISDPFEQAHAQAAIASAWENTEAALQITNSLLRDRALRDISLKTGQTALAEVMQSSYYRVQVLTAAGQYQEAWQIAEGLGDGYPLVALGTAWAEQDPQAAAQVLDALSREVDKAEVWRAIAVATGQQDHFQSALGMALAARVRDDALSPVQASLDLAGAFVSDLQKFESALNQAYDAAQSINIIY